MSRTKRSKGIVYSDAQVLAMCDSRIYWNAQLRVAAKQRGIPCTSVAPINAIVDALRATCTE